ncbi:MAG: DNA-3-methyladenine glycosylase II [Lentisphaeria bacterium]
MFGVLSAIDAPSLLAIKEEKLRAAGLSQRKTEYAKGLARAIVAGEFDPDALEQMTDENAIIAITPLRGFGRWSAEVYLMFSLGRADLFPADDLITLHSLTKLKRCGQKLTPKAARQMVEHWAPSRSAGSLLLWHCHHCDYPKLIS